MAIVEEAEVRPFFDTTLTHKNVTGRFKSRIHNSELTTTTNNKQRTGKLKPGMTVVEATSGNTGIALAMVCAQKGYPCVITMAETFSIERRKIMRALGAHVVLTPAAEKGTGMVKKAKELSEKHGYFWARQFENEANPAYHANTTGPEILSDFAGKRLDYWVTGYGT